MKPTFIGLGAQKCASSWLHAIFADHPQACVSTPKELNFFSAFYERGFQWYERHFQASRPDQIAVGEISPSYLPDGDAPARAHAYNPDFRILVALRDPVERAYSNFLHDVRLAYYQAEHPRFEDALANNPMYVEQSKYSHHLRRWFECFPRSQFLIVLQEEIREDPVGQARLVYNFLGIDEAHVSAAFERRPNESYLPRSQRLESVVRGLGRVMRHSGLHALYRAARRSDMVDFVRRRNRIDIRSAVPPMDGALRARLCAEFLEDTKELAALLNRDRLPWSTWEHEHQ
jgi:hypothetical protein